jgi:hypothetical protein
VNRRTGEKAFVAAEWLAYGDDPIRLDFVFAEIFAVLAAPQFHDGNGAAELAANLQIALHDDGVVEKSDAVGADLQSSGLVRTADGARACAVFRDVNALMVNLRELS